MLVPAHLCRERGLRREGQGKRERKRGEKNDLKSRTLTKSLEKTE